MIHCYKLGGLNIVLDIFSGSVHVVDEVAYDIIEMYEHETKEKITETVLKKYTGREDVNAEEIDECFSQIDELKSMGKLFSEDTFKPMAWEIHRYPHQIRPHPPHRSP